jgi:hypothetical protein
MSSSLVESASSRSGGGGQSGAAAAGGDGDGDGEGKRGEEGQAAGSSLAEHAEALAFLEQLVPADVVGPEVVAYAFRVKCLCHQERAADFLLGLAAEGEGALAALGAEMVRVGMISCCVLMAVHWLIALPHRPINP